MMVHTEAYPQSSFYNSLQWGQNPQLWGLVNPQIAQAYGQPQGGVGQQGSIFGLGQAAFGQAGSYGSPFGQFGIGNPWQRQLSQQDIGEIVRQLLPLLPQVVAQAQQQPQAAFGYGPYAQQWSYGQRPLSQQDVNEVVRQILPIVPQIVSLLQGQAGPHAAAIHGGYGGGGGYGLSGQPWQTGQTAFGQAQSPFGQNPWAQILQQQQQPFGPFGSGLPFQAAFGGSQPWGQSQQRQFSQADVNEVVRQLTATIPQVIANLQAFNQQQQRAA